MSELCGFVYNKGHQKSRETTREIWRWILTFTSVLDEIKHTLKLATEHQILFNSCVRLNLKKTKQIKNTIKQLRRKEGIQRDYKFESRGGLSDQHVRDYAFFLFVAVFLL